MSKISVIIPIYNVEQYLPKCLDSVVNQTYKNLEIICVNDCSPDNSKEIVKEYAKKDARIILLNLEKNSGLSVARNSGLEISTGEYIYFLDSDDWIDLDYLENMYNAIQHSNVEVVLNTNIIKEEENKEQRQFLPDLCNNNIENIYLDAKKSVWNIIWNSWAYLWKKDLLYRTNAKFPDGFINEDMYFQAIVLSNIEKLYVIRNSTYHYIVRNNSISNDAKIQKSNEIISILKILNKTADYFTEKGILCDIKIKLFVLITICNSDNKEFVLDELKKYFMRIKENVEKNTELYNQTELELFRDVCNNSEKVLSTNYYKKHIFNTIRAGLKNSYNCR